MGTKYRTLKLKSFLRHAMLLLMKQIFKLQDHDCLKTINNETCDVNTENIQIPESSKSLLPEVISQNSNKEQPELRRSDRLKNRPQLFYEENQNDEFDPYVANTQAVIYSVPKSFQEIKERDDRTQWDLAMKDELISLLINDTWKIVSKPLNKNI